MKKHEFFFQFDIFCEIHPPTRHIKYKVIDFAHSNKSVTASMSPTTNLELFLRRIKSRVNCPKLAKMAIFKTHNITKNDHR